MRSGFKNPPTEYYYAPFSGESEKVIGHSRLLNADLCIGSQLIFKAILEYTLKFTSVLKDYFYFALVWTVSLSHDYLNLPRLGDDVMKSFFKHLNINKTILILMSDHGLRWGSFRETYQGHLEERLPLLIFILPESFKQKYSLAYRNMIFNQNRLTTPFDLHETLKNLLDVTSIRNELLKNKRYDEKYPRGVSLFSNIPDGRTCKHAGIPAHYCTCHNRMVNASLDSPIVQDLSRILVSHINNVLLKNVSTKCHELKVHQVVSAYYEQALSYEKETSSTQGNWTQRDYTIAIITEPGFASFESTMRYNTIFDSKDIVGDVSRLNLYANQSSCVLDNRLKLYCYCR